MAPTLYKKDISPPCRAILITAKALEVELDYKDVDLASQEQLEEEYMEKNPQHTVPLLEDEDFCLVDSHAIMAYLVGKFGGESFESFYPEDLQTRALINHKLFYNCGTMQSLLGQIVRPMFYEGQTSISERLVDKVNEAYGTLEKFLGDREWFVGDSTTLADFAFIPSVTTLNVMIPVDEESFPKLAEWLGRVQDLPCYEANSPGLDEFKGMYDKAMSGDGV